MWQGLRWALDKYPFIHSFIPPPLQKHMALFPTYVETDGQKGKLPSRSHC